MTDLPFRERSNDRRVGTWLLLGLLVLFGGLYVAGYFFTGDRIPRGTTVAGIEIGGMHPASAERALADGLDERVAQPIIVSADGERTRIDPDKAGLSVNHAQSVEQAGGGRSWSPARMWNYLAGGDDFEAVVEVDQTSLDKTIAAIAKKTDQKAQEGGVSFKAGKAEPQMPVKGLAVDQEGSAAKVTEAFLDGASVVPLPVAEVKADITADEVRGAMESFGNPAMSAPVIIQLGGEDVVLRPKSYARAISLENQDGSLVPVLHEKKLMKVLEPAMKTVALQPKDATVKLVGGRPKVLPAKDGVTFDPKEINSQFLELVLQEGDRRTLAVKTVVDKPEFTTAEARKLNIKEVVSEFTTYFPHSDYRNTNLGRAADLVSGTVLKPGEAFSLNDTVGERTAENGFTEGFIISNGVYKEDFGGGVSQVATTLFNGAFFAGLEDVEHKPHSFYISRYPLGREATVAWGAVDLKFKNDTQHGVLIQTWITPSSPGSQGSMNVRMWSTKVWNIEAGVSDRHNYTDEDTRYIEDEDCVPNEGYRGFDVDVFRYFYRPGSNEMVRKETMPVTYTPSDTVICRAKPSA